MRLASKEKEMKSSSTTNEQIQPKKPYNAPELIEHGTIEDITGILEDNQTYDHSGCQKVA